MTEPMEDENAPGEIPPGESAGEKGEERLVRVYFAPDPGTEIAEPKVGVTPPKKELKPREQREDMPDSMQVTRPSVERPSLLARMQPDPVGDEADGLSDAETVSLGPTVTELVYEDHDAPLPATSGRTRGRFRPMVVVVALVITLGTIALVFFGWAMLADDGRAFISRLGVTPTASPVPTELAAQAPTATFGSQATQAPTNGDREVQEPLETPGAETPVPAGAALITGSPMFYIDGGEFQMGDPAVWGDYIVTLDAYYIDRTEVTNDMYAVCVQDGGCVIPVNPLTYDGSEYYGQEPYADYPVINVTWSQADTYCRWRGARLPSEAEWERAARWDADAETGTTYPWGDDWDPDRLNTCDRNCPLGGADPDIDDRYGLTAPVGSFPGGASPAGLLDMAGNVAEWVQDWAQTNYYAISDGINPRGPEDGTLKIVRGGAWGVSGPDAFSMTNRSSFAPDVYGPGLGFRCAVSAVDVED